VWPELDALLESLARARPGALHVARAGGHWVLTPTSAASDANAPLEVTLDLDDASIAVTIEGWTERFVLDDDDDASSHALDLVAAALLGRLRVHVRRRGAHVVGRRFVFATARGPVVHRVEQQWSWPWQQTTASILGNALPAPPELALGEGGVLPWAPWAGTLAAGLAPTGPGTIAIDGELDLHPFSPREVKPLVLEYIEACKERGITELRIVHGKGIGALRRTVHALLAAHPDVRAYRLGGTGEGSWGATIVDLHPVSPPDR
jgi:hypothetical protein